MQVLWTYLKIHVNAHPSNERSVLSKAFHRFVVKFLNQSEHQSHCGINVPRVHDCFVGMDVPRGHADHD